MRDLIESVTHVSGVEGAGCLLMHADGAVRSVAPSGAAARALEAAEELTVEGPCHEAFLTGEVVHVRDVTEEQRWPGFVTVTGYGPFRTIIGVPIPCMGAPIGSLNCFSARPHEWSPAEQDQVAKIAEAIGVAIEQALAAGIDRDGDALAAQLRAAVEQRGVIDHASQIVAEAIGVPDSEAARRIRQVATSAGLGVSEMCHKVLEHQGLPSPQELGDQAAETRRLRDQMTQMALTDALTGLANRALLLDRTRHVLDAIPRGGPPPTMVFFDLDRFKAINDSLGHDAGDQVLREVARRLREQVRAHDTVARLGGDEFAILLEGDDVAESSLVPSRIAAAIEEPMELSLRVGGDRPRTQQVRVRASLGVATADESHAVATDLLRDADLAMYHAKGDPNRRVQVFNAGLRDLGRRRWRIEALLREVLDGPGAGRPWLVYQPIIDVDDGCTVGMEALVRWSHPQLGDVGAGELIDAAEESGVIVELGAWLLGEACRQVAAWRGDGFDIHVAVNVSALQLVDPDFTRTVKEALDEAQVDASALHVEVTETQLLYDRRDGDGAASTLFALNDMGVAVSLDDFGTGFSSLLHVVRLPAATLKVDRTFVQYLPEVETRAGRHATAIVAGIVAGGAQLDKAVVAEGVETIEQHDRIIELGCRLAQGYLYARPALPEDLGEQLSSCWPRSTSAGS